MLSTILRLVISVLLLCVSLPVAMTAAQDDGDDAPVITVDNVANLEQSLMIGRGAVNDLAFSPDGSVLAVATSVGIWLYAEGDITAEPRFLQGHTQLVTSLVFSSDGAILYSGGVAGVLMVWDVARGERLAVIDDFATAVLTIALSPDNSLLAVAGGNEREDFRLYDTESLTLLRESRNDEGGWLRTLTFSVDGTQIFISDNDGNISAWDVATGERTQVWAIQSTEGGATELIAYDDVVISQHVFGRLVVSDSVSGEMRWQWDTDTRLYDLALAPDDSLLIPMDTGEVFRLDLATGDELARYPLHTNRALKVAVYPNTAHAVSYGRDNQLIEWDLQSGAVVTTNTAHYRDQQELVVHPDNQQVTTTQISQYAHTHNIVSGELVTEYVFEAPNDRIYGMDIDDAGDVLAFAVSEGVGASVRVEYLMTGETTIRTVSDRNVQSVLFLPENEGLLMLGIDDASVVSRLNLENGDITNFVTHPEGGTMVEHMVYSPASGFFAAAHIDRGFHLYNINDGANWVGHFGEMFSLDLAFDATGTLLALSDRDVEVWTIADTGATLLHRFSENLGLENTVAFSPDGRLLVSGGSDRVLRFYDVIDGAMIHSIENAHLDNIMDLAFTSDGQALVTISTDGTIRVWRVG